MTQFLIRKSFLKPIVFMKMLTSAYITMGLYYYQFSSLYTEEQNCCVILNQPTVPQSLSVSLAWMAVCPVYTWHFRVIINVSTPSLQNSH